MAETEFTPPQAACSLVSVVLPDNTRDCILGDLHEEYLLRAQAGLSFRQRLVLVPGHKDCYE